MNNGTDIRKAMRAAKQSPKKQDGLKGVIYDQRGQYAFPGQVTKIQGDAYGTPITMAGVPYPMYGEDDLGYGQMMYPGMDYWFPGQYVTEYSQHKVFETEEDFNKDRLLQIRNEYWPTKNTRPFDTGFDVPITRSGPGPVRMPSVTSDYQGIAMMYGGDPSLPNIEGHYQKGGTKIWTDKDAYKKAYKAERDSLNKFLEFQKSGWIPVTQAQAQGAKDYVRNNPNQLKGHYYHPASGPSANGWDWKYEAISYLGDAPRKPLIHNIYQEPTSVVEPIKEQVKNVEVPKKDYHHRHVDFNGPNPIMRYYDEAGKLIREEPYSTKSFGGIHTKTHTHMQDGGWLDELDEEYRRGGGVNPLMKSRSKRATTKKNIQSSINKLFLRNKDLFGPAGKNIYDPNSKYQEGGWLDQYQNAGTTGVRKPYILSDAELANAQPYQKLSKEEELAWLAMQPSQQPEHILRQTEKQGKGSKAWEVLMNPMTAATNLYQKGYLPDNFSQGPTNPLDIAFQMVNPLWRIDSAISAANAVKEGDYTSAAVDAAFTTPWGKVVKGAKTLKGLPKGKMEGPGTAKDLIKDKEAVKAIKNKIAQEKIDAYNAIQKLKTGRPKSSMGQNKFLSGERKISKQELDFTTKYPPTEGAGFYDYPTDPNYLYNFKTYSARPLEEIVTPYRKKLGGWLDNLD